MAPGSAVPSGKADQTLLFLMRPFPHGVLDTSAESIPNFETKNDSYAPSLIKRVVCYKFPLFYRKGYFHYVSPIM